MFAQSDHTEYIVYYEASNVAKELQITIVVCLASLYLPNNVLIGPTNLIKISFKSQK